MSISKLSSLKISLDTHPTSFLLGGTRVSLGAVTLSGSLSMCYHDQWFLARDQRRRQDLM